MVAITPTTIILTPGQPNPKNVQLLPGGPLTQQNGLFFNPNLPPSQTTSINAQRLGSPLTLLATPPVPIPVGTNYDFPNPVLPPSRTVAITSQILGTPEVLIAPPQVALPAGTNRDWPNPTLRVSSVVAYSTGPPGSPFALITPPPPDSTDAPRDNPYSQNYPKPYVAVSSQPLGIPLTLQPATVVPDAPRASIYGLRFPKPYAALLTQPLGSPATLLQPVTAVPFKNIWENPALPTDRRVAVSSQPLGIGRTLVLPAPPPPNQYDWPNPTLPPDRRVAVSSQILGSPLALFGPIPAPIPFNKYDWPNPVLPVDRRVAVSSQPLGFVSIPTPVIPPGKTNTPNPTLPIDSRVAISAQPLGSFTIILPVVIVGVGPAPATYPRIGVKWNVAPYVGTQGSIPQTLPPRSYQPANPVIRYGYRAALNSQPQGFVRIPIPTPPPPGKATQENPVRPKPRTDLLSITQGPQPQPIKFSPPPEPLLVSKAIAKYEVIRAESYAIVNLNPASADETVLVAYALTHGRIVQTVVVGTVDPVEATRLVEKAIASLPLPEDVP